MSQPHYPLFPDDEHTAHAGLYRDVELLKKRHVGSSTAGGNAIYEIIVFQEAEAVVVGDQAREWLIPEDLDGAVLTKVEAWLVTASSSGAVEVQIRNEKAAGGSVDMLTTKLSIDPNELNSKDAATAAVIDTANDDVAWGDHLNIDVDLAGTGAAGLGIVAYFLPAATVSLAVQGAKGDPGGVTSWEGTWSGATSYTTNQAVSNNGTSYVAIQGSTAVEPGVTAGWESYWMVLSEVQKLSTITVVFDGNGFPLDPGTVAFHRCAYAATITKATLLSNQTGSIVIDVWKDVFANFPPTDADSITASAPPTLASNDHVEDTTLSGWTTSIAAGDVLGFNIDSVTGIQRVTLVLEVERL